MQSNIYQKKFVTKALKRLREKDKKLTHTQVWGKD
jgi:hypothetical protein